MLTLKRMTMALLPLILLAGCSDVLVPPTGLSCDDALTRCDDANPCTFDDCDAATGECLYGDADGEPCEFDGASSTCSAGVCGGSEKAVVFCEEYEAICGFGGAGRYPSAGDCRAEYDQGSSEKQACIEQHLGFARVQEDPTTHCPHAAGAAPCDL